MSLTRSAEEFGIYLNYVRKLGFEETPDYEFLRELFAKVMKNNNDTDDGVYDWNLLNGILSFNFNYDSCFISIISFRWSRLGSHNCKFSSGRRSNMLTPHHSRVKVRCSQQLRTLLLLNHLSLTVEEISNIGIPTVAEHQR